MDTNLIKPFCYSCALTVVLVILGHPIKTYASEEISIQAEGAQQDQYGSTFTTLIKSEKTYIDKTLLILEILKVKYRKVFAISRPWKSGMTLNMHMMKDFFSIDHKSKDIFKKHMAIMQDEYAELRKKYMNSVPVIYVSFSLPESSADSFDTAYTQIRLILLRAYESFPYLRNSSQKEAYEVELTVLKSQEKTRMNGGIARRP